MAARSSRRRLYRAPPLKSAGPVTFGGADRGESQPAASSSDQARVRHRSVVASCPRVSTTRELPGIPPTIAYIDLAEIAPATLVEFIAEKVGKPDDDNGDPTADG